MKKITISILTIFLFSISAYASPVQVSNEGYFQSWPSMTVFNGDIYACYSVRASHGAYDSNSYVKVRKSTNGGVSWIDVGTFNHVGYDDAGCNLSTLTINGTPTIFLTWETYYDSGFFNHIAYLNKSTDGSNWGSEIVITQASLGGNYYYAGSKGRTVKLSNGDLIAPWASYYYPSTYYIDRVYISKSFDNGATWGTPIVVSDWTFPPSYQIMMSETSVIELKTNGVYTGSVLALIRKDYDDSNSGWFKVLSTDYGATWGTVTSNRADSGLASIDSYVDANPADLIRITGDTILAVFDIERGGAGGNWCTSPGLLDVYMRYSTAENADITWNNSDILVQGYTGLSYCDGGYVTAAELTTCGDIGFVYYKATAAGISDVWFVSKTRAELGLPTSCTSGGLVILTSGGGQVILGSGGKFITP
jgi:hypothetical protein